MLDRSRWAKIVFADKWDLIMLCLFAFIIFLRIISRDQVARASLIRNNMVSNVRRVLNYKVAEYQSFWNPTDQNYSISQTVCIDSQTKS